MYHLLVSYQGWPEGSGTISSSRVYIKASEAPGCYFYSDDKLDINKISRVPALLVSETNGSGSQFARVAYITHIAQGPRDTVVQYAVDTSIRPISNQDLECFSAELGLSKYTLTHTHWEVQDADLFKVLLRNQQKNAITPKVFSIDSIGQQELDLVSVMMPFSAEFDAVHRTLQEAVQLVGFRCMRADNFWEHHAIIQDIVNLIARARIVICDCSGRNPNVFYEAGIAHTLGKEVIIITQSENDVPFDLRHLRYIPYLNNGEGLTKLSASVQSRIKTLVNAT